MPNERGHITRGDRRWWTNTACCNSVFVGIKSSERGCSDSLRIQQRRQKARVTRSATEMTMTPPPRDIPGWAISTTYHLDGWTVVWSPISSSTNPSVPWNPASFLSVYKWDKKKMPLNCSVHVFLLFIFIKIKIL